MAKETSKWDQIKDLEMQPLSWLALVHPGGMRRQSVHLLFPRFCSLRYSFAYCYCLHLHRTSLHSLSHTRPASLLQGLWFFFISSKPSHHHEPLQLISWSTHCNSDNCSCDLIFHLSAICFQPHWPHLQTWVCFLFTFIHFRSAVLLSTTTVSLSFSPSQRWLSWPSSQRQELIFFPRLLSAVFLPYWFWRICYLISSTNYEKVIFILLFFIHC